MQNHAIWSFLPLLCATAQQSYCHDLGVRRPSVLPSVRRHRFVRNCPLAWHQILVTGTYPPYLQIIFFFKILNKIYIFFFVFVNLEPYGRKTFKRHLLLKYTSDSLPKKSSILLGRVSTKVVQRIVKFQILDFCQLYFSFEFANMGPYHMRV